MNPFYPQSIFVERRAREYPMAQDILRRFPEIPVREISSYQDTASQELGLNRRIATEKRSLVLAVKEGELVKQVERDLFRPTPNEYYIIHSLGCPFDCEYCFLYDYLDHQRPTIFVNLPDLLERIEEIIAATSSMSFPKNPASITPDGDLQKDSSEITKTRLFFHAGEFSDALAYDHLTNLSQPLVELFAKNPQARLEMRTKSHYVDNLIGLNHNGQTVISWTFSPQEMAERIEHQTASFEERLRAAQQVQAAGYWVGLRFDPIVWYPNWQSGYKTMIEKIFAHLDMHKISDISLGMFRATPGLRRVIQHRVRHSLLLAGEMVQCEDKKYRYFKPIRLEMYRAILGWIRDHAPNVNVELCMEAPEVEKTILRPRP
jgi:spore photoproduct lyase